ncbi:MAG: hypothetical protein ABSF88_12320 [Candidatus Aminicenantales bacterium]
MNLKKKLIIEIPLVIFILAAGFFILRTISARSMFPFKEQPDVTEMTKFLLAEKDPAKQIAYLKQFVKDHLNVTEVQRAYQDIMLQFGRGEEIAKEYREYLIRNPEDPMFNYLFGRLAVGSAAEGCYKKSLETDENYYWGHLGLAYYYFNDAAPRKADLAKDHLAKALKIDKSKPHAYFSLLTIYRAEKNKTKALEMLEILTKFFPDRDYLFLEYADLKFPDKLEHKKALEKKLMKIPHSSLIEKALADLALAEGQWDEAQRYLESTLKDEKFDHQLWMIAHYQLAEIFGKKKDSAQTLAHLKDAVKNGWQEYAGTRDNPNFSFLRDNAEFKSLLKGIEPKKTEPSKTAPVEKI